MKRLSKSDAERSVDSIWKWLCSLPSRDIEGITKYFGELDLVIPLCFASWNYKSTM